MSDTIQTVSPDQLGERSEATEDLFALVFSAGGPLQKLAFRKLLSKLISTNLCKTTKALLDADLAHAADEVALVFNDPTASLNGWYRKTGASGAGAWSQFEVLVKAVRDEVLAASTSAAASAATATAAVPGINAKLDIYQDYTYGAATIAATGTANAANTARWYTAATGRTGPLTQFEIAGEGAGTVKVIIQRPNAGTPANWDNVISFSLTIAAGVNTFSRAAIEAAAGGLVNITPDMRIGLWSASAIISLGTGSTFVSATRSGDPTGLTNFTGTTAAGFVIFRATVTALTDTPINSRVLTLQGQQAVTDATLTSYRGALTAGYDALGTGIDNEAIWGTGTYNRWMFGGDWGVEIDIPVGKVATHLSEWLQTFTSATTQARLTVLFRDLTSPSLNSPSDQPGDVIYGPYTNDLAAMGLTPGTNVSALCRMAYGTTGIPRDAWVGKRAYFRVEGLDAASALSPLGTGRSNSWAGTVDQGKRGWFGNGTGTNYPNSIASPYRQSWRVETLRLFGTDEIAKGLGAGLSTKLDPTITPNFLLPDRLWLTAGRTLPFNVLTTAQQRIDASVFDISIQSLKYLPNSAQSTPPATSLSVRGTGMLQVNPDQVGATVTFTIRRRGVENVRYREDIPATVVPWVKTGSPVILGLGDSLMAQFKMGATLLNLTARGMTPTFIGDRSGSFNGQAGTTASHEGRGGKAMADYTYARVYSSSNVNTMRPCDDITYSAYIALPDAGLAGVDAKQNRNPFLVASSAPGSNNGYIWSLARYLSYTGKPTPTHIFIALGTNDIFQTTPLSTALANITAGINTMVAQIRAVSSTIQICFYSDAAGWTENVNGAGQFYENHFRMMQTQQAAVRALIAAGDTRLAYIPLGLHQDDNRFGLVVSGYGTTTSGSPNVVLSSGSLTAGQVVTMNGFAAGTTVVTGASAGGTAVLSANASLTQATAVSFMAADTYGLQTVIDDPVQAGYVHPTDTNIATAAEVLASWVAATS